MSIETGINGSESVKSNGANEQLQGDIKDVLVATSESGDKENDFEQRILKIDEIIGDIFDYCLKANIITSEREEKERNIYDEEIKPRLQDEEILEFVNRILSKNNKLLPSRLLREIENFETIKMMEKSAKHIYPSAVIDNLEVYAKFAKVKELDEKQIISRYIDGGLPPRRLDDEYEDYLYIKNYEYKNEELKPFLLSLINDNNVDPSLVAYFFDIFKDDEDFGDERKEYIITLINTKGL